MDAELFEALVRKLHRVELVLGDGTHLQESWRFCHPCHIRIECLMPVIEDRAREVHPDDW